MTQNTKAQTADVVMPITPTEPPATLAPGMLPLLFKEHQALFDARESGLLADVVYGAVLQRQLNVRDLILAEPAHTMEEVWIKIAVGLADYVADEEGPDPIADLKAQALAALQPKPKALGQHVVTHH